MADSEIGSASGSLAASRQLGNALGVAGLGTVFFTILDANPGSGLAGYGQALSVALILTVTLVVIAAVVTMLLPGRALRESNTDVEYPSLVWLERLLVQCRIELALQPVSEFIRPQTDRALSRVRLQGMTRRRD